MNAKLRPRKAAPTPQDVAVNDSRARVFKDVGLPAIHTMGKSDLLKLQEQLGLGSTWGFLVFPAEWMAPGTLKQPSARRVDIEGRLKKLNLSTADFDLAVRTVTAGVLLCLASPVYNPRYTQYLRPSTVKSVGIELVKLARRALELPARIDGKLLARLPRPGQSQSETDARVEIERFERFAERGLWSDVPERNSVGTHIPLPSGPPTELPKASRNRVYAPLSDEFLGAAGYRIVWLVETLGPALLRCGHAINRIRLDYPLDEGVRETQRWHRTEVSKAMLAEFEWTAPDGSPITAIPFPMDFSGMGKGGKFSWPPRTLSQVRMLLRQLQSAQLFMFLISTGGRISEALSLQPGCVVEAPDGIPLANGRTYKLALSIGGKERDWPLPAIAVQALKQQEELASFAIVGDSDDDEEEDEEFRMPDESPGLAKAPFEGREDQLSQGATSRSSSSEEGLMDKDLEGDVEDDRGLDAGGLDDNDDSIEERASLTSLESIWTREGGAGEVIHGDYNVYLRRLVKVFGLSEELGEGNLHAHRFRKSTARLIALSILGAPKILMDLFGHKQIGMTLHYILSDPTIRAEMLEVAQAQTIMLAKTAIVTSEESGGPAAAKVKAAVEAVRFRMGEDFGDDSIEELAETLTNSGRSWQLVRPGVLCTKGPQVAGACTPSTAMPEPSRCRTKCAHRLEMGYLRDDVDKVIHFAVSQVEQAVGESDLMKAEMWKGQILTNINRFGSLKAQWSTHPIVSALLEPGNTESQT